VDRILGYCHEFWERLSIGEKKEEAENSACGEKEQGVEG
jgi:hypothetical protein